MRKDLIHLLADASGAGGSVAHAALLVARIEYPDLDPAPYLARLDAMGDGARHHMLRTIGDTGDASDAARVSSLNAYLFEQEGFCGNRDKYEDPRNSFLNEVLDRRTGIPITLSLVYMEVARRAGLEIDGVNFPGHFLVTCPQGGTGGIIIDPFHGGAVLSERDCRVMLRNLGPGVAFNRDLLVPATSSQILIRMLLNLKSIYVDMRSFPQARDVTELLLALNPSALSELRDRGLLAYHMNDLSSALRDLQTYLKLSSMSEADDDSRQEHERIWGHVKTLRRRMAALN